MQCYERYILTKGSQDGTFRRKDRIRIMPNGDVLLIGWGWLDFVEALPYFDEIELAKIQ